MLLLLLLLLQQQQQQQQHNNLVAVVEIESVVSVFQIFVPRMNISEEILIVVVVVGI